MLNSSGVEKIYSLTNGLTDGLTNIQKSDLYSEVALAKNGYMQVRKNADMQVC